jgi:predicted nucleic acid-binding protein
VAQGELEARLVTLDTSAIFAALNKRDVNHVAAAAALNSYSGQLVIPTPIMAEIAYFIEREFGTQTLDEFLGDIVDGAFILDCGYSDLSRIRQLVTRYADLPLGYADAAVIACAERRDRHVLSFDLRHFGVVGREGTFQLLQ